ncbi:hypothetical protein LCGC14_2331820 [marine sediment metagenome]|uniref:Uncharacterized protein n=1 Tax=marine sediment metagenome TaxID=412755 RepID=A0A0F9F9M7_9ZZZZ
MKLYTITLLITGPPLTERNFASVAGTFIGRFCQVGWHLGQWPVTLSADGEENS